MTRNRILRRLALFLAAVMVLGCVSAAQAAKSTKCTTGSLSGLEEEWYYLPDTVPENYLVTNGTRAIYLSPENGGDGEYASSITAEFVSGDEWLKEALTIQETREYIWENEQSKEITVPGYFLDFGKVKAPGQAVFHITAESEKYLLERDCTFRVLSWEEHPLFAVHEDRKSLVLKKDDVKSGQALMDGYFEDHSGEIAAQAFQLENKSALDYYASIMDPETDQPLEMDDFFVGATNNTEPKTDVVRVYSPYSAGFSYYFQGYGTWLAKDYVHFGNVRCDLERTVAVLPYSLNGGSAVAPGATVKVEVKDEEENSGRTFTLTLEGEGVTLDEAEGTLTAAEDTATGTGYALTATPSDGGLPVTVYGKVAMGLMSAEAYKAEYMTEGFSVPVPEDETRFIRGQNGRENFFSVQTENEADPYYIYLDYRVYNALESFAEDEESAAEVLELAMNNMEISGPEEVEDETVQIDGHPARLLVMRAPSSRTDFSVGGIFYVRNNRVLRIRIASTAQNSTTWEDLPRVTMADMEKLAESISYDPSRASITVQDGEITLSAKDDASVVSGGKKLKLTAAFANPDRVNKKAKNDGLEWSVIDVNTREAPENVTVDKNGSLSVGAKLAEVLNLEVRASSAVFHTQASYPVTAIPAAKKLTVDPAELYFYVGTDTPQSLKALPEPETVPPLGITWTASKKDIVEITAGEDGTAEIKPLAAGKITVTAKEPGGKSGKASVSIVEPVTGLELTMKGKAQAGKTVTLTAALEPKKAGNKNLEWSVDVDEAVASITAKGQLKIAKTAEAGTEITVTCKALGAPEPIVKTLKVTVE